MRVLIDENLPDDLAGVLRELGHDVEHVYTLNLGSTLDPELQAIAEAEERFLVTLDTRFADARNFTPGEHPGIALVRLKHARYSTILDTVREAFVDGDLESWRGCIVVISEGGAVRIHRK